MERQPRNRLDLFDVRLGIGIILGLVVGALYVLASLLFGDMYLVDFWGVFFACEVIGMIAGIASGLIWVAFIPDPTSVNSPVAPLDGLESGGASKPPKPVDYRLLIASPFSSRLYLSSFGTRCLAHGTRQRIHHSPLPG
jgi:hypothetical protein